MNKQQLLDKENPTLKEKAMQQLLANGSVTSLEADRRTVSKLLKQFPTTALKSMPLQETLSILEGCIKLANGENLETNETKK